MTVIGQIRTTVFLSVVVILAASGCNDSDEAQEPVEYHLTVGDTTIVIPDSAVQFAGGRGMLGNFIRDAYMLREYQVAHDPDLHEEGAPFQGTVWDWRALSWDLRSTFLMFPQSSYTRDAKTDDDAQYYYWIGTHLDQFGYGWRDTFDPEASLDNPAVHIWLNPADSTLRRDDPATVQFDGESQLMQRYRAMWILTF